jgi:soluble lytic murein transglycosylase
MSSAGALGLMQVMPATGELIARQTAHEDFAVEDLTDPPVAIEFGTWYLARQVQAFEGWVWPALAAYNGGPGNARTWWNQSHGDLDAFVESIGIPETSLFVRLITEHQAMYGRLYPGSLAAHHSPTSAIAASTSSSN